MRYRYRDSYNILPGEAIHLMAHFSFFLWYLTTIYFFTHHVEEVNGSLV